MSSTSSAISREDLEEYCELLYLSKSEIINLHKRWKELGPEVLRDRDSRFDGVRIGLVFPEVRWNPFQDRILDVFSSRHDGKLSFEDVLDLFSVLNAKCPDYVKAEWAFRIFDFDGDGQLNRDDIVQIIDRLIPTQNTRFTVSHLDQKEKYDIADKILTDLDLDKTGGITATEFCHAVMKIPDFFTSFRIKV